MVSKWSSEKRKNAEEEREPIMAVTRSGEEEAQEAVEEKQACTSTSGAIL